MPYYIYLLECSDKTYYCGYTKNLEKRVIAHNTSKRGARYTFVRRPVKLVWYTDSNDINYAIDREKQIKGWTRKKKEALIDTEKHHILKSAWEKRK